jgi:YVTN family beta-propeller protein
MEFSVLGPLEVREDGRVIPLGGAKQRALLASLLLHANEVVSRDRLIDGLWGQDPPATAAHIIETYVSRLRRVLREVGIHDALIMRPPGYMLRIDPDELDLNRFENLLREGRRALGEGNPETAAEHLQQALALFRGPPLDDVAFFPFAQAELGRLVEMRLSALEGRIDADLAGGRSTVLVGELEALVKTYPLRERLHGQLMLACYRAGRQADALDAYRRARQYLAEELGVEPGRALRELEHAILVQDPSLEPVLTKPEPVVLSPSGVDSATVAGTVLPSALARRGVKRRPVRHARQPEPPSLAIGRRGLASPRRVMALLVTALLVASLTVGFTVTSHDRPPLPETVHGDAMRVIDPGTGAIVDTVPLGESAGRIVAGAAGSVWVTNFDDRTVSRMDSGRVRQVIPVGGGPCGIAIGNGAVWVADALDGTVARIDPGIGRVVETIPVGSGPSGIAYGEGAVWVANTGDHTVVSIDPRTGKVTRRIRLATSPADLAIGDGSVWATSESAGEVFRISPDGKDVATIRVGAGPSAIATDPGGVWVANSLDGTVSRIDALRDVVTARLKVGHGPSGLAVSPEAVWVTNEFSGTVTRIDPHSPVVAQTIRVGNRPVGIAMVKSAVWVVVHGFSGHRDGTLRIAAGGPRTAP